MEVVEEGEPRDSCITHGSYVLQSVGIILHWQEAICSIPHSMVSIMWDNSLSYMLASESAHKTWKAMVDGYKQDILPADQSMLVW